MKSIQIIIVDDHKIVRDGIFSLLIGQSGIEIAGEAGSGPEALALLKTKQADVMIVDVSMPGMTGIELTKIITKDYPGTRVLILSANDDRFTLTSALKAGALAYLSKDASREELISAIRMVAEGKHYLGSQMHRAVFESLASNKEIPDNDTGQALSDREKEIVKLFAEGNSYKEIAEKLHISARTVESHKKNILEKLHLENTIDLVKYAIQEGLIRI